ncbi:MAG: hypothetical protein J6R47_03525 [Acholeplasmatales bacterium]|nr:hypothetical protein [Acholeplasmatales bacterium]
MSNSVIENAVLNAVRILKGDNTLLIQGQNDKIDDYYKLFVGNPTWSKYIVHLPDGKQREDMHKSLNAARYMCRTWANNYANENTTITIPKDQSNNRLQEVFSNNKFFSKFNNFTETFMGLGIGATLVNIDKWLVDEQEKVIAGNSNVKIQFIKGRRVIPITVVDGEVVECAFLSCMTGGCKLIIHWLDENGNYNITELIGKVKNIAETFDFDYLNMKTINTRSNIAWFQIWQPNITGDDEDTKEVVGTAITDKAFDAFFQCDVTYTALYKEIKLGQKVKFIKTDVLQVDKDGNPIYPYDENDESIIALEELGSNSEQTMQEFNSNLRVQQLIQTLNFHLNVAAMLCGLGATQFEFDSSGGRPLQTATAVIAKQTELYRNVIKQENLAIDNFKALVEAICYVNDNFTTNQKIGNVNLNEVQITFDDNIMEDTESKKKQDLNEVQVGTMSIAEYRAKYYDEDFDTALEFLQENGMLVNVHLAALQSGAMTPEMFVKLVYGENIENKEEVITYITEKINVSVDYVNYQDESDNENEQNQEDDQM